MYKSFTFVIFSVLIAAHFAHGGGLSDEAKTRRQTCGSLVKPNSGASNSVSDIGQTESTGVSDNTASSSVTESANTTENSYSSTGYNCTLTDYFYECSVNLTSSQYTIWIEWINTIRTTILADYSLTDDQKVSQIGYSLEAFFKINVDIKAELSYAALGSWGNVQDIIYVAYEIQVEASVEIVTLDSNSDCALFDALRNATANDSEKASAVEKLIAQITAILKTSSWSYAQQQAQISLLFQSFFSAHASWKADFDKINIQGFGSFYSYVSVTNWYSKATTIGDVINGDSSNCDLLLALQAAYQSTTYTLTVRNQIKQLYEKLSVYFASTTDISLRLSYFSSQCYEYYQLVSYLDENVETISLGSWGSIKDLLFCSQMCTNSGCGNLDNGPGTYAPSSTTLSLTTLLSTTPKPADCSTRAQCITIDSSNQTIFTNAVSTARASWSSSNRASFNTYWNNIVAAIWSTTLTQTQIINVVVQNCKNWNANNAATQQLLFSVTLTQWYGNVGQYVACGSA